MPRKSPITLSPIAQAETPIYKLARVFQNNLFFPDPSPLYALAGSLVANYHVGHPVWLMLIGSPSCGKSVLLNSLSTLPGVVCAAEINGTAALLSGVRRKDVSTDSKGGLLHELGPHGALVIEEFTSILSQDSDSLRKLLAAFRSIYYGSWSRTIGTEGGRKLEWRGKVAMFAACTQVLERYAAVSAEMGERWIYYRFPETRGWAESRRNLERNFNPAEVHENLCNGMLDFIDTLGLQWGSKVENRRLLDWEVERLVVIAQFAARARSAVPRDARTFEILDSATPEPPMRLANTLAQLYLGMESSGLELVESWRIVRKVALDCVPFLRAQVLRAIREGAKTFTDIAKYCRTSPGAAKRAVEDLVIHRLLETKGAELGYTETTQRIWTDAGFDDVLAEGERL